jgi:hypothetical protein
MKTSRSHEQVSKACPHKEGMSGVTFGLKIMPMKVFSLDVRPVNCMGRYQIALY